MIRYSANTGVYITQTIVSMVVFEGFGHVTKGNQRDTTTFCVASLNSKPTTSSKCRDLRLRTGACRESCAVHHARCGV